jgi:hypothetical protein
MGILMVSRARRPLVMTVAPPLLATGSTADRGQVTDSRSRRACKSRDRERRYPKHKRHPTRAQLVPECPYLVLGLTGCCRASRIVRPIFGSGALSLPTFISSSSHHGTDAGKQAGGLWWCLRAGPLPLQGGCAFPRCSAGVNSSQRSISALASDSADSPGWLE